LKALRLPPNPDLVVRSRQSRASRGVTSLSLLVILLCGWINAQTPRNMVTLSGYVRDKAGAAVAGARVEASGCSTVSDADGAYLLVVPAGSTRVEVSQHARTGYSLSLDLTADRVLDIQLGPGDIITVHAEQDTLNPDPSTKGYSSAELLQANPGRPGVPFSIPGLPVETPSGGIKAPQYFAPGVAGDHGEPIAQFLQIDNFLLQNNLTANAHGNGYADPNFVISSTLAGAMVNNGAFNVRYGDHSINLAVTYDLRDRLTPFVQATTDGLDGAITAGWGPSNPKTHGWIAAEGLWGNGFLERPEERQQYKLNGYRAWSPGKHELAIYGAAYYGFSRIPGLIPLDTPVPEETIDNRQADLTHTTIALITDQWQLSGKQMLTSGAYFRTYSLNLKSNFGDGLIQQSEFRTVAGGSALYTAALGQRWSLLAGLDARRDAPRGLNLAKADDHGVFHLVTSNDLTITDLSPYAAVNGRYGRNFQVYLGARRDQILFNNQDFLQPANSFDTWAGTTSPKVNVTLGRVDAPVLPQVAFSYGKAFHANDPRIGTGDGEGGGGPGDLIIQAREFQLLATKIVANTQIQLTLARVSNSAELAKIDPDTGLQQNQGPSLNRYLTLSVLRRPSRGMWQISWSQADARDRDDGTPVPEAPRMIVDAVGMLNQLAWGLSAQAEYEYVKAKPLGDGFTGVPLQEIRMALHKSFQDGRWQVSLNGQLVNGFTGQTTETLAVGNEKVPSERVVGVPTASYASVSVLYSFGR
jgi:Carboxypeptidase regulatory-like domain